MAFTYKITANPTGVRPYRGVVDSPTVLPGAAYLAAVATAAGKDGATVEAVLRAAFTVIAANVSDAKRIGNVLGLFRVFPLCGGSYAVPDPAASDVQKTVSFNITPTPEFVAGVVAGLTMQKTGETGLAAPDIASVITMPGGVADSFTPGQGLEIRGQHLRGRASAFPTVELINNTTPPASVPILVIEASDIRVVCNVPTTGFDGSCFLKVTTPYGSEQRVGQYSQILALVT